MQDTEDQVSKPVRASSETNNMLNLALRHHQAGRLAQADELYGQVLRAMPDNPDALHLSGLAAYQMGKLGVAVQRIGRAVSLNPANPMYYSNLGLAFKAQGQVDEAIRNYQKALSLRSDLAEIHHNLGVALGDAGRLAEAASSFRRALDIKPDYWEASCKLGNVLQGLGDHEAAIASLQKAIELNPACVEALCNLAGIHQTEDRLEEAVTCMGKAIAFKPDAPELLNNLGTLLSRQGKYDEAISNFRQALAIRPDYAKALNNLGIALREKGDATATACFRQAVAIQPDYVDALGNLGGQLQIRYEYEGAVECYQRLLAISPENVDALCNLGYSLRSLGRLEEAGDVLQRALSVNPDSADAYVNLAALYIDQGKFDDVQAALAKALALVPEHNGALGLLTTSRKMTLEDSAWLDTVSRLVQQETLPPRKKYDLYFALGKFYDDTKQYDLAFDAYTKANTLQRSLAGGFDRQKFSRLVDKLIKTYDSEYFSAMSGRGSLSELPVIIAGMPRSGTSLMEQVIASHPQVYGAGELFFWLRWFEENKLRLLAGKLNDDAFLITTATRYEQHLRQYSSEALRIVDKMPSNFMLLGLLHLIFPRARLIHMRRNPVDTCLSIYFQNLSVSHEYGNDLDDLAYYYREYDRLMCHWRQVIPGDRLLEVKYESLLEDQEGWSRRIMDFVGLEWDAGCLDFHRTERRVGTSSNWQVRQKIYHSSRERWRHYEKYVGKLLGLLELDR